MFYCSYRSIYCSSPLQVLSNVDELFDREELSAAPDPGWPDCFNSGVFVFRPSLETHGKLLQYCTEHGSFDGKRRRMYLNVLVFLLYCCAKHFIY